MLVVDDEEIVRDVLSRYLEREGFRVDVASDGETAVELAERFRPDIVVLDLMLPKLDGLEVFRRIRIERDLPILMLTAKSEEVDRVVGLELGADDYVTKPFSPREVVARIRGCPPPPCPALRRQGRRTDRCRATGDRLGTPGGEA